MCTTRRFARRVPGKSLIRLIHDGSPVRACTGRRSVAYRECARAVLELRAMEAVMSRDGLVHVLTLCGSCGCPELYVDPHAGDDRRVVITDDFGNAIRLSAAPSE